MFGKWGARGGAGASFVLRGVLLPWDTWQLEGEGSQACRGCSEIRFWLVWHEDSTLSWLVPEDFPGSR